MASPVWIPGSWCGVAYKALFDFVLARNDFDYRTVNADYGCGIIVKNRTIRTEMRSDFSKDLIGTRSNSHDILTWPCRHIASFSRNI